MESDRKQGKCIFTSKINHQWFIFGSINFKSIIKVVLNFFLKLNTSPTVNRKFEIRNSMQITVKAVDYFSSDLLLPSDRSKYFRHRCSFFWNAWPCFGICLSLRNSCENWQKLPKHELKKFSCCCLLTQHLLPSILTVTLYFDTHTPRLFIFYMCFGIHHMRVHIEYGKRKTFD